MKYSNEFVIYTFFLFFGSTGAQASTTEEMCRTFFSENQCYAAFHADELLTFLEEGTRKIEELRTSKAKLENEVTNLKKTAADLRAANKDLESDVLAWRKKAEQWEKTARDSIDRNRQLESDIAGLKKEVVLLEPGAKRFDKFMQMFPQKAK